MAEKPIIFSGPMVRAILNGRKNQTRRILKPQPEHLQVYDWKGKRLHDSEYRHWCWKGHVGTDNWDDITTQLGPWLPHAIGDRLYVREAHYLTDDGDTEYAIFAADEDSVRAHLQRLSEIPSPGMFDKIKARHSRLRPSIHMPKWAVRLWLEVTDVRVQRVQDISEADAKAEGTPVFHDGLYHYWGLDGRPGCTTARHGFANYVWNAINGPDAWDRNDWVAAYTFERIEREVFRCGALGKEGER